MLHHYFRLSNVVIEIKNNKQVCKSKVRLLNLAYLSLLILLSASKRFKSPLMSD